MKKINLLSKAEMKKILGGTDEEPVIGDLRPRCVANCGKCPPVTCYPSNDGSCSAEDNVGCKNFNNAGWPANGSLVCSSC